MYPRWAEAAEAAGAAIAKAGLKGGTTRVQGVPAWFGLIRVSMLDAGLGGGGCTNAPLYGSAGTAILGCGVKEK